MHFKIRLSNRFIDFYRRHINALIRNAKKSLTVVAILSVTWALSTSCILSAKEHPEHPEKKEHPKGKEISNVTLKTLQNLPRSMFKKIPGTAFSSTMIKY